MKWTPTRLVLLLLALTGVALAVLRFVWGLGATTHLSDRVPWGLWVAFDVMAGVALSAGGFTMAAVVYVLGLKKYRHIAHASVLTAFIGYLLVIMGLLLDLGRPLNLWHPIVYHNIRSVLFEVAWCVMLYTTVLALEFSPHLWRKLGFRSAEKAIRRVYALLVVSGIILSTMHQSSLGNLYLITAGRLNGICYTPLLGGMFFVSAVAAGIGMVTLESYFTARATGHPYDPELMAGLAGAQIWILFTYLAMKLADLTWRGQWSQVLTGQGMGLLFLVNMFLGVLIPLVILLRPTWRKAVGGQLSAAFLVVLGVVLNRLIVVLPGMGKTYWPSWIEIMISVGSVALGVLAFLVAIEKIPGIIPVRVEARAERSLTGAAQVGQPS